MCGIVGWVDFDRDLSQERFTLEEMTQTLRDRGPDAEGTWVSRHALFGHRRLAVVDIEGGRQPMVAETGIPDRPVVLTYSGEVYNYRELRAELRGYGHSFRTESDTEVVLRAYLQWGSDFVRRLNGMFAFALWDARHQRLLLVRDRLGVKPLYYHRYGAGVIFASEPKGILASGLFAPRIRLASLPVLFNPRMSLPGETPLEDLHEVRPGHLLVVSRGSVREECYWQLASDDHPDDEATTVRTVRELLEDIVDRQMTADVPQSTLLSGGLDSSAISALAARTKKDGDLLRTFSVDFSNAAADFTSTPLRPDRDAPYAELTARHIGSEHTAVTVDPDDFPSVHEATLRARDLPSLGQFDESIYLLFRAVRETSTVALSGEAADEIFGGYPWFQDERAVGSDTFPWLGDAPRLSDCLAPGLRERIRPEESERDRYRTLLAQVPRKHGESGIEARMREVLYLSMQGPLGYLLNRKDRMSMAVGLEVRVPFCDHRLIEYLWNVPWRMKVGDGREKSVLRAAVADLLPEPVLQRRKSAYPATFSPRYGERVRTQVDTLLADTDSPLRDHLDADRVRELAGYSGQTMAYASTAQMLTPLIEVNSWMRRYQVQVVE